MRDLREFSINALTNLSLDKFSIGSKVKEKTQSFEAINTLDELGESLNPIFANLKT